MTEGIESQSYLSILWIFIRGAKSGANKSRLFYILYELRTYDERFRRHDDTRQVPAPCKMNRFLQVACPYIACRIEAGFVEKQDWVRLLLVREENAELWAEGSEDDSSVSTESENFIKYDVDKGIQLNTVGVHFPIFCLPEHWVF